MSTVSLLHSHVSILCAIALDSSSISLFPPKYTEASQVVVYEVYFLAHLNHNKRGLDG